MKRLMLFLWLTVVMPMHIAAMERSSSSEGVDKFNRLTEQEIFGSSFNSLPAGEGYGDDDDKDSCGSALCRRQAPTPSYGLGGGEQGRTPNVGGADPFPRSQPQFSPPYLTQSSGSPSKKNRRDDSSSDSASRSSYSPSRHADFSPQWGEDVDSVSSIDAWDQLRNDLAESISKENPRVMKQWLDRIFAAAKKNEVSHIVRCVIGGYLSANEATALPDFDGGCLIYASNAQVLAEALYLKWASDELPEGFARELVVQTSVLLTSPRTAPYAVIEMLELFSQTGHFIFRHGDVGLAELLDAAAAACDMHEEVEMMLAACYADFLRRGLQCDYLRREKSRALHSYLRMFKNQFPFHAPSAVDERRNFLKPLCNALKRWARDMNERSLVDIIIVAGKEMQPIADDYTDFIDLIEHVAIQVPHVLKNRKLRNFLYAYCEALQLDQDCYRLDALLRPPAIPVS